MRVADTQLADAPALTASFAACIAAILEVPVADVPAPRVEDPWTPWRNWLATRGIGFVEVHDPASFNWPGPWIAVLRAGHAADPVAAVAFGSPPGIVWHPLGGEEPFERLLAGYLLAPHDVALWAPRPVDGAPREDGRVELIAVAEEAGAAMRVVHRAVARAGHGLEGDRYARGQGTFSNVAARGHDLTLIEAEHVAALALPSGRPLPPEQARRNIVTRGIDLNALVGRRFHIGEVECLGQRLCEPCAHLEGLSEPGILRALVHRGGLRADVLTDGVVEVGAEVRPLPD
jgi:MOSC domain-containing protein YiiM